MAALDILWIYVSSALVLALIATLGFLTLKTGIFLFKIVFEALIAVERMERYQTIYYKKEEITDNLEITLRPNIFKNYFKNFRKYSLRNPKYAYIQLFKK